MNNLSLDFEDLNKKSPRIFLHLIFWGVIVGCLTVVFGIKQEQYLTSFIDTLLYLPAELFLVYVTLYLLIPRYLLKGKKPQMVLGFILAFIITGLISRASQLYLIVPLHAPYWSDFPFFYLEKILRSLVVPIAITGIAASIKLYTLWNQNKRNNLQLRQDKLEAELGFLKAQINPHFLFNTLNNLYSFTLRNSKDSHRIVLMLSELLHYMLYECNAEQVQLQKEVQTIRTYTELEKLRYGKRVDLSFQVHGPIEGKMIAPLLLLPFVENSFTHGLSEEIDQAWITIDLKVQNDQLKLKILNSKDPSHSGNGHGNIGLNNVRQRLDLIYPGKYTFEYMDEGDTFMINLQLPLK